MLAGLASRDAAPEGAEAAVSRDGLWSGVASLRWPGAQSGCICHVPPSRLAVASGVPGLTRPTPTGVRTGLRSGGCSARYSVDRPILRWRAMAVTDSPRDCRARATASTSSLTAAGRPPRRPWASAARSPSRVRSRIRSRSISAAIAATMNSILSGDGRPVGAVDPGADAGQDVQVDSAGVQLVFQQHQQFLHGPGDPVRLVDHQRVPGLQLAQGLAQLRPVAAGAGGLDDDLAAVRRGERVELGLVFLRPGGDPGVADAGAVAAGGHGSHGADRPGYRPGTGVAARGSGTSFRDGLTWAGRRRWRWSRKRPVPGPGLSATASSAGGPARAVTGAGAETGSPAANRPAGEGRTHGRCTGDQRPGRRVPRGAYRHGCGYFNGYCIEPG